MGDYLKDGADIVNIEDLEAIFVDFRLPERFQTKIQRGQRAMVDIDALPGRKFDALVQAIDPLVDANGRSVGVRGCIDNRQLQLRPGMFARVTAVFGERDDARVIPEEAIVPQGGRQFVIKLVEGPDERDQASPSASRSRSASAGPGRVEITEGLQAGRHGGHAPASSACSATARRCACVDLSPRAAGGAGLPPRRGNARPGCCRRAAAGMSAPAPAPTAAAPNPCAVPASARARAARPAVLTSLRGASHAAS